MIEYAARELHRHLSDRFRPSELYIEHDGKPRGYRVLVRPLGKDHYYEITDDSGVIIVAFYRTGDVKPYYRSVFPSYEEMMRLW